MNSKRTDVSQQDDCQNEGRQQQRGNDVVIMQVVGHRVAWHTVYGRRFAGLLNAVGKERLFVIDGNVNVGYLDTFLVSRQMQRVRLVAVMNLCRLEGSLNGRVLLGRCGITRQGAQHLIGCARPGWSCGGVDRTYTDGFNRLFCVCDGILRKHLCLFSILLTLTLSLTL